MKTVLQILLLIAAVAISFFIYKSIQKPIEFEKAKKQKEMADAISRFKAENPDKTIVLGGVGAKSVDGDSGISPHACQHELLLFDGESTIGQGRCFIDMRFHRTTCISLVVCYI